MSVIKDRSLDFESQRRQFQWSIPAAYNIGVDVCDRHGGLAEHVAIYYEDAAGACTVLTFGQLREQSDRFANALRGLGVQRGDRVAIVLAQRPETAVAHVALYKLGAIALPLSVLFGPDALEYRLRDSGAKAVICDAGRRPVLETLQAELADLDILITVAGGPKATRFDELVARSQASFQPAATTADEPAMLIYTSGTTGPPKGALNAHRCLLGNLPGFEMSHDFFPNTGDLMYSPADWAWTGGLLDALLPALRYGVPVLAHEGGKFDPQHCLELMARYRVRNAFIPPTAMKMLMQAATPQNLGGLALRSIMSAGEQVGAAVLDFAENTLQVSLNEMFGQTEFNYIVGNCRAIMAPKAGSMGKPYPGHDVTPIDETGEPVAVGETGEIAARIGDPVMFLGYWNKEQATQDKIVGDWFRTGDTGYRDEDGYLWFVGRNDDVISTAGYRVGPGEIEDCLLKHPAVAQAAVIGSPDDLRGSLIKAYVVAAAGVTPDQSLISDIQADVKHRLAAHEYPREIEFIDAMPMTTTGKVRRMELRKLDAESKTGNAQGRGNG